MKSLRERIDKSALNPNQELIKRIRRAFPSLNKSRVIKNALKWAIRSTHRLDQAELDKTYKEIGKILEHYSYLRTQVLKALSNEEAVK